MLECAPQMTISLCICRVLMMNGNSFADMLEKYRDSLVRAKKLGIEDLPEAGMK